MSIGTSGYDGCDNLKEEKMTKMHPGFEFELMVWSDEAGW